MADKQQSPTDTRDQAAQIKEAWAHLSKTVKYGDMALTDLEVMLARLDTLDTSMTQLEEQLASVRNEYNTTRYALWDAVKRVRAGARATHGDDSFEYERFGGTRLSQRRRPRLAAKPTAS